MNKLYVIKSNRPIPCLDGIVGPLTTPTQLEFNDVLNLVRNGFAVYECNPANSNEQVKVTLNNINHITFKESFAEVVKRRQLNREIQKEEQASKVKVVNKNYTPKKESKVEKPEDTTDTASK